MAAEAEVSTWDNSYLKDHDKKSLQSAKNPAKKIACQQHYEAQF